MSAATAGLESLVAAYREFAGNGAGRAPEWVRTLREAGIDGFGAMGFPTTAHEDWRFTTVAALAEGGFALATPERADAASAIPPALLGSGRFRVVFVNGRFDAGASAIEGLPEGVTVASLADVFARDASLAQTHLGRSGVHERNAFAALNTAFAADGAYVHVAPGVEIAEPIEVLFLSAPGSARTVSHPRTLLVVERLARASVVEVFAGEGTYWTNAVMEVVVGDGARADVYRVQQEGRSAYHVASTHTRQGRDSVVNVHPITLGAALARHDITAVLDGEGARCLLNGLYLGDGTQHVDHHTVIDHAKPHGESHEYFNGVLDERSRGVFAGRIIVRPGAQRTDSKQTNNNLLLSEEARADSQPQLEIYADDVKCTHGATLGPIDPKALFYLESRGLGKEEARALLTYGFGAEILERMDVPALRQRLERIIRARLLEPRR